MANTYNCGGTGGCLGATAELGFGYTQIYGLTSEYKYSYGSYQGQTNNCTFNHTQQSIEVTVDGYFKLPENSYPHLLKAVATVGPIAINVDASQFHNYETGVFTGCDNSTYLDINHVVVLIGYGTDATTG